MLEFSDWAIDILRRSNDAARRFNPDARVRLSRPALAVVGLLSFEQSWNEFLPPLLYISNTSLYTLPLGLYNMVGADDVAQNWNLVMAGAMMMVLPVVTIFVFTQQFFAKGIALSGIKG